MGASQPRHPTTMPTAAMPLFSASQPPPPSTAPPVKNRWARLASRTAIYVHMLAGTMLLGSGLLPARPSTDTTSPVTQTSAPTEANASVRATASTTVNPSDSLQSLGYDLKDWLHRAGWTLLAVNLIPASLIDGAFGIKKGQPGFLAGAAGNLITSCMVPFASADTFMRWRGAQGLCGAMMSAAFANAEENDDHARRGSVAGQRQVCLDADHIKTHSLRTWLQSIGLLATEPLVLARTGLKATYHLSTAPFKLFAQHNRQALADSLRQSGQQLKQFIRGQTDTPPDILHSPLLLRLQALTALTLSTLMVWQGDNPEMVAQLMKIGAVAATPSHLTNLVLAAKRKDMLFFITIPMEWFLVAPNAQHDWAVGLSNLTFWPAQKRHMIHRIEDDS
ncbi:MAG: hypothetical protein KC474_02290 [Cyanobacteria bacterium HKST-UBA04]|nr:hypothetical protein [Cyanobacteria bacterium HKST-UBA04]